MHYLINQGMLHFFSKKKDTMCVRYSISH